jgi:hypothetical protein
MRHLIALAATTLATAHAAACPLTETLASRYGISFSGFTTPIPASAAPRMVDDGKYVRVVVADTSGVSDGFHHAVLMDVATRKAWILRTGGFPGVYQWYGPVDVGDVSTVNCRLEQVAPRKAAS